MEAQQRSHSTNHTTWQNRLPAWVMDHPMYASLHQSVIHTLQCIANKCDPPDQDGSLLNCYGGQALADQCGNSKRTLMRHIKKLEEHKLIVTLKRGFVFDGRNYANVYGIPGSLGLLDARRVKRMMLVMIKGSDGKYRPRVVNPGDQAKLPFNDTHSESVKVVTDCHGGSDRMTPPPCQNGTLPSPLPSPYESKNHGDGASTKNVFRKEQRPSRKGRKRLGHVNVADLTDTTRLLGLFDRACEACLIGRSDADRFRFVAAAEHALRVGKDPHILFATNVRRGKYLFISQADEDAASARLKKHMQEPAWPAVPAPEPTQRLDIAALSDDARLVLSAAQATGDMGISALRKIRESLHDFSQDRFSAAGRELARAQRERQADG